MDSCSFGLLLCSASGILIRRYAPLFTPVDELWSEECIKWFLILKWLKWFTGRRESLLHHQLCLCAKCTLNKCFLLSGQRSLFIIQRWCSMWKLGFISTSNISFIYILIWNANVYSNVSILTKNVFWSNIQNKTCDKWFHFILNISFFF